MIVDIYRSHLAALKQLRKTVPGDTVIEDSTLDAEIARIETHIHNLETDHRDCVTPCSLSCKAVV
jgi:hypothetical protein